MEQDDDTKDKHEKISARDFVLRVSNPFNYETQAFGQLSARRQNMGAFREFMRRAPEPATMSDADIVRAYAGSVSSLTQASDDDARVPLMPEQADRLTPEDLASFSRAYLKEVAESDSASPVADLAQFARTEREEQFAQMKRLSAVVQDQVGRAMASAEVLKNWKALSGNVHSVASVLPQIQRVLGSSGVFGSTIGDTIRRLREEREGAREAVPRGDFSAVGRGLSYPEDAQIAKIVDRPKFQFPEPPPVHETPPGRTANAVEGMQEAVARMEEAMTVIVQHAGQMSETITGLLLTIQSEAQASQTSSRKAFWVAALSLFVGALALLFSAAFSWRSYSAERAATVVEAHARTREMQSMTAQTLLLRSIRDGLVARQAALDRGNEARAAEAPQPVKQEDSIQVETAAPTVGGRLRALPDQSAKAPPSVPSEP